MTRTSDLHIIDDFYSDPDEMRKIALNSEFDEDGNYPGMRTQPHLWNFDHIKEYLDQKMMLLLNQYQAVLLIFSSLI